MRMDEVLVACVQPLAFSNSKRKNIPVICFTVMLLQHTIAAGQM